MSMLHIHICLCSLKFLLSFAYRFQGTALFSFLVRFIPAYVILPHASANSIFSLIYLSNKSLLVYRNATDCIHYFYILYIYLIHWWFLVVFWRCVNDFLWIVSHHVQTVKISLLLSFQFFSFFSCLIAVGAFRLLSMVLTVSLLYMALIMLKKCSLYTQFLDNVYHKRM